MVITILQLNKINVLQKVAMAYTNVGKKNCVLCFCNLELGNTSHTYKRRCVTFSKHANIRSAYFAQ